MYACHVTVIDNIRQLSAQCMSTAYVNKLCAKQGMRKDVPRSFEASKLTQIHNLFTAMSKLCPLCPNIRLNCEEQLSRMLNRDMYMHAQ